MTDNVIYDLLVIPTAGLIAGVVCKRLRVPVLNRRYSKYLGDLFRAGDRNTHVINQSILDSVNPPVVQAITYTDPLPYFLVMLRGMLLEGTSFSLLLDQFWPMSAIAAVTLSSAVWLSVGEYGECTEGYVCHNRCDR